MTVSWRVGMTTLVKTGDSWAIVGWFVAGLSQNEADFGKQTGPLFAETMKMFARFSHEQHAVVFAIGE